MAGAFTYRGQGGKSSLHFYFTIAHLKVKRAAMDNNIIWQISY